MFWRGYTSERVIVSSGTKRIPLYSKRDLTMLEYVSI